MAMCVIAVLGDAPSQDIAVSNKVIAVLNGPLRRSHERGQRGQTRISLKEIQRNKAKELFFNDVCRPRDFRVIPRHPRSQLTG